MSLRYCFERFPLILDAWPGSAWNDLHNLRRRKTSRRGINGLPSKLRASLKINFLSLYSGARAIKNWKFIKVGHLHYAPLQRRPTVNSLDPSGSLYGMLSIPSSSKKSDSFWKSET